LIISGPDVDERWTRGGANMEQTYSKSGETRLSYKKDNR